MIELSVISGCQVDGLVSALAMLLPDARVTAFRAHTLLGELRREIEAKVRRSDIVFAMPLPAYFEEFTLDALRASTRHVLCLPQLEFSGLHPDVVYAATDSGWAQSPTSDYHSNICLAAYLCGLSAERTAGLFNAYVFEKLGYFDQYERSRRAAILQFANEGVGIGDRFDRWEQGPVPFMYTPNHPKAFVLADLAMAACDAASLKMETAFPYDFMPDYLATSFVLPVFPELGVRRGIGGHRRYRLAGGQRAASLSLAEFVGQSFALYESAATAEWRLTDTTKGSIATLSDLLSLPRDIARVPLDREAV